MTGATSLARHVAGTRAVVEGGRGGSGRKGSGGECRRARHRSLIVRAVIVIVAGVAAPCRTAGEVGRGRRRRVSTHIVLVKKMCCSIRLLFAEPGVYWTLRENTPRLADLVELRRRPPWWCECSPRWRRRGGDGAATGAAAPEGGKGCTVRTRGVGGRHHRRRKGETWGTMPVPTRFPFSSHLSRERKHRLHDPVACWPSCEKTLPLSHLRPS